MSFSGGVKKAYYRTFQGVFNVAARCLVWRRPLLTTGAGSVRAIPELLSRSGVKRVMVVTGPHIIQSLGPTILGLLDAAGVEYQVFSQVEANPSVDTVEKIFAQYASSGCQGFIALGGGSPMDAAKAAAARAVNPGRTLGQMAGLLKVGRRIPPLIAIPTTSGTGSETTIAAVITDRATSHK